MSETLILQPGQMVETNFGLGVIKEAPFQFGGMHERMVTVKLENSIAYISECFWNTIKSFVPPVERDENMLFIPIFMIC